LCRRQPRRRARGRLVRAAGRPRGGRPPPGPSRAPGAAMNAAGWVAFVVAGAVGAPLRYELDGLVGEWVDGIFPWGILLINVAGSFLLGLLTGLGLHHGLGKTPRIVLGTGFCGAF